MFVSIYPQPTILTSGSPRPAVKFPQDVQVILRADRPSTGNLFIGNVEAAQNKAILQNFKISAVLCVAKGYGTKHSSSVVKYNKYLPVEDNQNADFSNCLAEGVAFIAEKLKDTNVLVHCVAGTNRSAVFVMAFLMKHMGLTLEQAYNEVKSRRKIISPTEEMLSQLKIYEENIGVGHSHIKINRAPSIRFNHPSTVQEPQQRSIRIKTNQLNHSNFLDVADIRSNPRSKAGSKMRMDQFDDRRSLRPSSVHSSRPAIEITQPKSKNPEESFISKQSKAPSALDRSFYSPSQANRSILHQSSHKESYSKGNREEFWQKLHRTDSKNREINQKIDMVHERFDHCTQNNRLEMQSQLSEISQMRSNLHSQQSERKEKMAQRRSLHDKSMENREAQQYIASLPLATAVKRRL